MSGDGETADVQLSETAPDDSRGSLTIPRKRLAGSPGCLNCGTLLQGPFCYYCGQPDKNLMRFFPALARELMQDFLELDSRFMRTLVPLLFHPGKLTRDYLDGRRFRYTPPLRLYLFSSMGFFILAAMIAGSVVTIDVDDDAPPGQRNVHIGIDQEEDLEDARAALEKIDPALADRFEETIAAEMREEGQAAEDAPAGDEAPAPDPAPDPAEADEPGEPEPDVIYINDNDEPWDAETNPFIVPFLPDFMNDWINREIGESPQKGREIEANPNIIIDKVFEVLPITMFILLPIAALLFKFWYLFARKYYVEHLILALHNHSFLFVIMLISVLSNAFAGWLEPSEEGPVTTSVAVLNACLLVWLPIYYLTTGAN